MRIIINLFVVAVIGMIVACSSPNRDEQVANALALLQAGDFNSCSAICNDIISDSTTFNSLSVAQLCQLSEILVNLEGDLEANDALAARCLSHARTIDSDSVDMFINASSTEVAGRLMILDRVGAYLGIPRDSLVSTDDILSEIDSIIHD